MGPNITAENIRYLLWRDGIDRSIWVSQLAAWIRCSRMRAQEILAGALLESDEQNAIISNHPDISVEMLQYERLVAREYILKKNLEFLFENLEHGKMKELAKELEVSPVTISRWKSGTQKTNINKLNTLCHKLALPPNTNLQEDALFLTDMMIGQQKRDWLKKQIDTLSPEKLDAHFPSLEKILKDP